MMSNPPRARSDQARTQKKNVTFQNLILFTVGIALVATVVFHFTTMFHFKKTSMMTTHIDSNHYPSVMYSNSSQAKNNNENGEMIESLKEQIERLESQLEEKSDDDNDKKKSHENIKDKHKDNLCQHLLPSSLLSSSLPNTVSIWRNNLPSIFNASRNPRDEPYEFHDWTALMLHRLPPSRLLKSIKTLPSPQHLRPVLDILIKRKRYLEEGGDPYDKSADVPPPLRILALGGSVTMGVMCPSNAIGAKVGRFGRKECAWPFRLNFFLNQVLGMNNLVEVENMSLGGTNTDIGRRYYEDFLLHPEKLLFENGLPHSDTPHPDVVINAYSTNDMNVLSMLSIDDRARGMVKPDAKNITLEKAVFDMTQSFIRSVVYQTDKCSNDGGNPPLLIYLDDYLGNEQNGILETMEFTSSMHRLASYYGIMSMSYADVVRHIVYADTKEWWFSPNWYGSKGQDTYKRQIHHHMGSHIAIMWTVAFNFLNAITIYCAEEDYILEELEFPHTSHGGLDGELQNGQYRGGNGNGLPSLTDEKVAAGIKGGPGAIPNGPIPPLTPDLTLQEVSQLWEQSTTDQTEQCKNNNQTNNSNKDPCIFSWIANTEIMKEVTTLDQKMNPLISSNTSPNPASNATIGWRAQVDNNKLGFVPTGGQGSTFVLEMNNLRDSIKVINIMAMKSYGDKWEGSKIRVSVFKSTSTAASKFSDVPVQTLEVEGSHASKTSVTYPYRIELKHDSFRVGESLRVKFELISGFTFKITGMSFCNR